MKTIEKFVLSSYVLSVILFDMVTKELLEGVYGTTRIPVGLNDAFAVLLILMATSRIFSRRISKVPIQAIYAALLIFYFLATMAFGKLVGQGFEFLREAQFIYRSTCLTIMVFYFWDNPAASAFLFRLWKWLAWLVCGVAVLQGVGSVSGLKLIPWSSGRVIGGVEQLTSLYYEPAAMCQFLVATLFILFRTPVCIKSNKFLCVTCIIITIASQSVGGIVGLFFWVLFLLFRRSKGRKMLAIKIGAMSIPIIGVAVLISVFPNNRVTRLFVSEEVSGGGSAGRRLNVEYLALQNFVVNSPPIKKMVGLNSEESRRYREEQYLTEFGDNISGNGLVEYVLRYGILGLILLVAYTYALSGFSFPRFVLFWYFFGLILQIDGAIAKPWIFTYTMAFVVSMMYEPDKLLCMWGADRIRPPPQKHRGERPPVAPGPAGSRCARINA